MQVRGAALGRAKHISPLVVSKLWKVSDDPNTNEPLCLYPCSAEQTLPLLQQPLQELLQAVLRITAATSPPYPSESERRLAVAQLGVASWGEVLQLLPLARHTGMYESLASCVRRVVAAESIAAGELNHRSRVRLAQCTFLAYLYPRSPHPGIPSHHGQATV